MYVQGAAQKVIFGPFVDVTDGVTRETTISAPTAMKVWYLFGNAYTTINLTTGGRTWTHRGDGYYEAGLITTDFIGGPMKFAVDDAAARPVSAEIDVVSQEFMNFMLDNGAPEVAIAAGGITAASFDSDAITADALATDAALEIAGAVQSALESRMFSRVSTITGALSSNVTLDSGASAENDHYKGIATVLAGTGAGQSARITGYVGATKVLSITPSWASPIPTAGSVIGIIPDPPSLLASVTRAQIWDELLASHTTVGTVGNFLRLLFAAATTLSSDLHANSIIGQLLNKAAGTWGYDRTTDSLEALRDRGDAAWTASTLDGDERNRIADAVLRRNLANARAAATAGLDTLTARSLLGAGSRLVNKVSISGTVMTVCTEDDTTPFTTCVLVGSSSAQPTISIDPA